MYKWSLTVKVKKFFLKFLSYIKENPLIFLIYSAIFGIGIFLRFLIWRDYGSLQWDEASHSVGGIFFAKFFAGNLNSPSDYLANYPATVASFWFYPYGYSLLASLGYLAFGISEFTARLPSVVFSVLLIHATISVTREVKLGRMVSLLSGFFIATSSLIIIVGSGAMLDVPMTTLIIYSFLFWIRGLKNRKDKDFLKAGILGGLAGLIKPTGILILLFIFIFGILLFLFSKDRLIFSRGFWKGILGGVSIFSTWWISAVLVNFLFDGWIGEEAIRGVKYWFDFSGVFGKYVPPWYSPPWYKIEAWYYYPMHLLFAMGLLPFVFVFVGVFARFRKAHLADLLLILFALGFYVLQTFASNKNPRYILPILPILYVYASVGLNFVLSSIRESNLPPPRKLGCAKRTIALLIVILVLAEAFLPLQHALEIGYIPGMRYGFDFDTRKVLEIVMNDKEGGLIILDTQDNLFNVYVITFHLASMDKNGKYGCYFGILEPNEIFNFTFCGKKVRYILVQDLNSNIGKYINANPEFFTLLGEVENTDRSIYIYKVKG